jgi:hypothetical protein
MTNKLLASLLTLLLIPAFTFAQSIGVCGTSIDTESALLMNARALANRQIMDSGIAEERDDEVIYIPIKYHLFGKADGTQVAKASNILGLHCRLNEEYAEHEIQFYINDGFEYHFNDNYYTNPGSFTFFLNSNRSNNSVNVFIGTEANPPGSDNGPGVTLGYYSPGDDWIVLRKSEATYNSETFPHEMGHFLSLNHPFNGWECQFWEDWADDNPGECAPSTSTCGFVPTERANGSNCSTAGDYLCDTPANYGLGISAGNNCSYSGNACDPTGAQLEPDPTNFMGYFNGCPDMSFTPEQIEMALTDYNSNFRNYLRTDGGPTTTEAITATTVLSSPADMEELTFSNVTVDWEDTPHAEKYVIQTALNASFSLLAVESIADEASIYLLDYLNDNTTYFWRVAPFNEYSSCMNWSESRTFKTGSGISSVATVEGLTEFTVSPNPASRATDLTFSVSVEKSFTADFELISVDGKSVYSRTGINFAQGNSSIKLNTQQLAAGLYFATLRTANGVMNKRVVITE